MQMKSCIEVMLTLVYAAAASLDYIHRCDDKTIREKHVARFDLLTPVVKGWCTELA